MIDMMEVSDKLPSWITPLLRFGAMALIAFYLVWSNNEMMRTSMTSMSKTLIVLEKTTDGVSDALLRHEASSNRILDGQLRLLRVICRNTATDSIQRSSCDNN
jgi:hypothetical protein